MRAGSLLPPLLLWRRPAAPSDQWLAELLPGFLVRREMGDLAYAYLVVLLSIGLAITSVELYRASTSQDGIGS